MWVQGLWGVEQTEDNPHNTKIFGCSVIRVRVLDLLEAFASEEVYHDSVASTADVLSLGADGSLYLYSPCFIAFASSGFVDWFEIGLGDSDWGHAKDYIKGMWLMVQRDEPSDYVLSTGECHSVKEFVEEVRSDAYQYAK